ncbi:MAG: RING finger domain-containing protein [Candidatus Helarchaeota archaeon]
MQHHVIKNAKKIYALSIIAIIWEVLDLFLSNIFEDVYYNMFKYLIIFSLIILFIIQVNIYGFILFIELIPIVNIIPFFSVYAIYSIIYTKYKKYKFYLRPGSEISHISQKISDKIYCPSCGTEIKRGINKCPNCGKDITPDVVIECPICRSKKLEPIVECPICKTKFHRRCFLEWVKIKGTCPICKNPIDTSSI